MQIVLYKQRHVQLFTVDYHKEQNMIIMNGINILFHPKIIYYTVDTENTPDFRCQAMPDIRCWICRGYPVHPHIITQASSTVCTVAQNTIIKCQRTFMSNILQLYNSLQLLLLLEVQNKDIVD